MQKPSRFPACCVVGEKAQNGIVVYSLLHTRTLAGLYHSHTSQFANLPIRLVENRLIASFTRELSAQLTVTVENLRKRILLCETKFWETGTVRKLSKFAALYSSIVLHSWAYLHRSPKYTYYTLPESVLQYSGKQGWIAYLYIKISISIWIICSQKCSQTCTQRRKWMWNMHVNIYNYVLCMPLLNAAIE